MTSEGAKSSGLQLPQRDAAELVRLLQEAGVDFARHRPVVFGSRAIGRARRYSDIDVAITGASLCASELAAISEALEESNLPYRVDLVDLTDASDDFRAVALSRAVALEAHAAS